MGDSLIVMVLPDEALRLDDGSGRAVTVIRGERIRPGAPPEPVKAPERHYLIRVPESAIWSLPGEPEDDGWQRDRARVREHREAVRASLGEFINQNLAKLNGYVRTGAWILGAARVRVVELRGLSKREIARWTVDFLGPGRKRRRSSETS